MVTVTFERPVELRDLFKELDTETDWSSVPQSIVDFLAKFADSNRLPAYETCVIEHFVKNWKGRDFIEQLLALCKHPDKIFAGPRFIWGHVDPDESELIEWFLENELVRKQIRDHPERLFHYCDTYAAPQFMEFITADAEFLDWIWRMDEFSTKFFKSRKYDDDVNLLKLVRAMTPEQLERNLLYSYDTRTFRDTTPARPNEVEPCFLSLIRGSDFSGIWEWIFRTLPPSSEVYNCRSPLDGSHCLHIAAQDGNLRFISFYVMTVPSDTCDIARLFKSERNDGWNVYACAFLSGRTQLIKKMMEFEEEESFEDLFDRQNSKGRPLMFYAAMSKNAGVFEWAMEQLQEPFDFEIVDDDGKGIYEMFPESGFNKAIVHLLREYKI